MLSMPSRPYRQLGPRCHVSHSILDEKETLNLDPHQVRQAETQKQSADGAVTAQLPETYQWLLVPEQGNPQAPVTWQAMRLSGGDELARRASKKLKSEEFLVASLGSTILRKHLDDVPLWRGDSVSIRQLVEDFARYVYLPRLAGPEVLVQAMRDGVALLTWQSDAFGYAESQDEASERYRGLRGGQVVALSADDAGLIVKSHVARRQLDAEVPTPAPEGSSNATPGEASTEPTGDGKQPESGGSRQPKRFYGTVRLDPARVGRDAGRVAEEVIAHLVGLSDAKVVVTLEIEAHLPSGASEQTVRVVTENGKTLKFKTQAFESE